MARDSSERAREGGREKKESDARGNLSRRRDFALLDICNRVDYLGQGVRDSAGEGETDGERSLLARLAVEVGRVALHFSRPKERSECHATDDATAATDCDWRRERATLTYSAVQISFIIITLLPPSAPLSVCVPLIRHRKLPVFKSYNCTS